MVQVERLSNIVFSSTGCVYLAVLLSGHVVMWLHQTEWSPLCYWAVEKVSIALYMCMCTQQMLTSTCFTTQSVPVITFFPFAVGCCVFLCSSSDWRCGSVYHSNIRNMEVTCNLHFIVVDIRVGA